MTISLEVDNRQDLELLLLFANRLGIKLVKKTKPPKKEEKELARALKIIEAGVDMPEERLQAMLKWHEEDRNDDSRSNRPT